MNKQKNSWQASSVHAYFIEKPIKCPISQSSSSSLLLFPFRHILSIAQGKNRINSFVFFYHCFQYTQERKLIKQNHGTVLMFTGVCMLNGWNWIINHPPIFLQLLCRKRKAVDFIWLHFVGEDRLKQNNHRIYLHFFQSTVLNEYIYMRIEE